MPPLCLFSRRIVRNVVLLSAHSILISGLTIAVALGGLAFLPISFLATIGITMSVGAVSAVCVSMTLMPSMLLVFFKFFATSTECSAIANCYKKWRYGEGESTTSETRPPRYSRTHMNIAKEDSPFLSSVALKDHVASSPTTPTKYQTTSSVAQYQLDQYNAQMSSIWFKIGRVAFRHPWVPSLRSLLSAPRSSISRFSSRWTSICSTKRLATANTHRSLRSSLILLGRALHHRSM